MEEYSEEQRLNPQNGDTSQDKPDEPTPRELEQLEAFRRHRKEKEARGEDKWFVVLARGVNEHGLKIYHYLALREDRVEAFRAMEKSRKFFDPEEWGVIVESGIGNPTAEIEKRMSDIFGPPAAGYRAGEDIDTSNNFRGNMPGLTGREIEVMELVAKGMTNIEIGEVLNLSSRTIQKHVGTICNKLGLTNRAGVASFFTARHLEASAYPSRYQGSD